MFRLDELLARCYAIGFLHDNSKSSVVEASGVSWRCARTKAISQTNGVTPFLILSGDVRRETDSIHTSANEWGQLLT
jgi:hypothetical protein